MHLLMTLSWEAADNVTSGIVADGRGPMSADRHTIKRNLYIVLTYTRPYNTGHSHTKRPGERILSTYHFRNAQLKSLKCGR
jgi:hypothetical protein